MTKPTKEDFLKLLKEQGNFEQRVGKDVWVFEKGILKDIYRNAK